MCYERPNKQDERKQNKQDEHKQDERPNFFYLWCSLERSMNTMVVTLDEHNANNARWTQRQIKTMSMNTGPVTLDEHNLQFLIQIAN